MTGTWRREIAAMPGRRGRVQAEDEDLARRLVERPDGRVGRPCRRPRSRNIPTASRLRAAGRCYACISLTDPTGGEPSWPVSDPPCWSCKSAPSLLLIGLSDPPDPAEGRRPTPGTASGSAGPWTDPGSGTRPTPIPGKCLLGAGIVDPRRRRGPVRGPRPRWACLRGGCALVDPGRHRRRP